jgi:restriction system protein
MALWKVQAGEHGEQINLALEHDLITIGWEDLGDLSAIRSREDLESLYKHVYPDDGLKTVYNCVGQIWAFKERIAVNDYVVLPLKNRSAIALGNVGSQYEYREDLGESVHHTRRVKWIAKEMPRSSFGQDLLYSFGALMTVCQITRNNAETRVIAIAGGKKETVAKASLEEDPSDVGQTADIEELADDQIQGLISRRFRGHKLAELIDAILKAEGYTTLYSAPGPDGGLDILAGNGPMGFDSPHLCVQVKSSDTPADVGVLRELLGTMKTKNADHGLLVSWGGFKETVRREATSSFFQVRLWDKNLLLSEIVDKNLLLSEIVANYDKLPESLQADLPLKRIWVVAAEEGL